MMMDSVISARINFTQDSGHLNLNLTEYLQTFFGQTIYVTIFGKKFNVKSEISLGDSDEKFYLENFKKRFNKKLLKYPYWNIHTYM